MPYLFCAILVILFQTCANSSFVMKPSRFLSNILKAVSTLLVIIIIIILIVVMIVAII